jgi:hypothetical protein
VTKKIEDRKFGKKNDMHRPLAYVCVEILVIPFLAKFGSHFAIPDDLWSEFFFIKYDDGFISPKAPSPEEVSEFGYNAPEMASLLQIVGYAIIGSPDLNYPYWEPEDFLLDNDGYNPTKVQNRP